MYRYLLLLSCASLIQGQYDIRSPNLERISPNGLRMDIPHEDGITLFAVHYSINKPVTGVQAGDYNCDVLQETGGEWVHENTLVTVLEGDTVNFWHYVLFNGAGYQLTDQSWIATNETFVPVTTTTAAPTPAPSTTTVTTTSGAPTTTTTTTPGPKTPAPPITTPSDGSECTTFPCLVFEDEFDTLDFTKWGHEITAGGGGNWEFQYYTNNRSNSYVRDGVLYIKPTLTEDKYGPGFLNTGTLELWGASPSNLCTGNQWYGCLRAGTDTNYINPIQSARIRTVNSFHTRYGKVDVEAQMPKGDWIWPAVWMLPAYGEYGDWPASGEIDILESRGNENLTDANLNSVGNDHIHSTMHWGPYGPLNRYDLTTTAVAGNFTGAFHLYSVEWNANQIIYYLDNEEILRVDPGTGGFWEFGGWKGTLPEESNPWVSGGKMAPFDKSFYIIMNVAVGGTNGYFHDSLINSPYPKPWLNTSPTGPKDFALAKDLWYPTWNPDTNNGEDAAMKVKSIRVWKMSAAEVPPTEPPPTSNAIPLDSMETHWLALASFISAVFARVTISFEL